MLNFENKTEITSILNELKHDTKPNFGIMSPQHMVEHLILLMKISTEKLQVPSMRSAETAAKFKNGLIYTEMDFPNEMKAPGIPQETVLSLRYENLNAAIEKLSKEIDDFHNFFHENSDKKTTHPVLGLLNYEEWKIFHAKHFTHHFRQFGIL